MRTVYNIQLATIALVWALAAQAATAQAGAAVPDTLNRVDEQGRKQGWWQVGGPVPEKPDYGVGTLYEEGRYEDNKRAGTWKRYWPNGKPRSVITYVKGLAKGAYATYYPNGRPEEQGVWDLDRNTGAFQRWYDNGQPMQEFIFDAYGTRNGAQKYYHQNGKLAVEVSIANGREEGVLKRYYPNGDLQETAEFHGGAVEEDSFRSFKPKGPVADAPVPAEAKAAPAKAADEQPNAEVFHADGRNILYDAQHRLSQKGIYRKGRLWEGRMYHYNANGILYKIEVYANGRYVGKAPITDEDK